MIGGTPAEHELALRVTIPGAAGRAFHLCLLRNICGPARLAVVEAGEGRPHRDQPATDPGGAQEPGGEAGGTLPRHGGGWGAELCDGAAAGRWLAADLTHDDRQVDHESVSEAPPSRLDGS